MTPFTKLQKLHKSLLTTNLYWIYSIYTEESAMYLYWYSYTSIFSLLQTQLHYKVKVFLLVQIFPHGNKNEP